jgi:hypothetical protein
VEEVERALDVTFEEPNYQPAATKHQSNCQFVDTKKKEENPIQTNKKRTNFKSENQRH